MICLHLSGDILLFMNSVKSLIIAEFDQHTRQQYPACIHTELCLKVLNQWDGIHNISPSQFIQSKYLLFCHSLLLLDNTEFNPQEEIA